MNTEELQNNAGKVFKPIITNVNYDVLNNTMLKEETVGISNALIISIPDKNIQNNSIWVSDNNGHITPISLSAQKLNNIIYKPSDELVSEIINDSIKPIINSEIATQINKSVNTPIIYVDFYNEGLELTDVINTWNPHKYYYTGEKVTLTDKITNQKQRFYLWELYDEGDKWRIEYKKYLLTSTIDVNILKTELFTQQHIDKRFDSFEGFLDKDSKTYDADSKGIENVILLYVGQLLNIQTTSDINSIVNNALVNLIENGLILRIDNLLGNHTIEEAYENAFQYLYKGEKIVVNNTSYYLWEFIDTYKNDSIRTNNKKYIITSTINIDILKSQLVTNSHKDTVFTSFKGYLTKDKSVYELAENMETKQSLISINKLIDLPKNNNITESFDNKMLKILSKNLMIRIDNDLDGYSVDDVFDYSPKYVYTGECITNVYNVGTCYIWEYIDDAGDEVRNEDKKYLLTSTVNVNDLNSQIITDDNHQYFTSFIGFLNKDKEKYYFSIHDEDTHILLSVGKFIE